MNIKENNVKKIIIVKADDSSTLTAIVAVGKKGTMGVQMRKICNLSNKIKKDLLCVTINMHKGT